MTLDSILEEINKSEKIVLLTHENPDGDAIGSTIALYRALKNMGKEPCMIIPEFPVKYSFLEDVKNFKKESDIQKYDLAIALDCSSYDRLNGYKKYFDTAKTKVLIDHHGTNTMFGDLNFVNPDAPATAQALIEIFNYANIEIDKEMAKALYTGIITDTGGLKYSNVKVETLEYVASLMEKNINIADIARRSLDMMTKEKMKLIRNAMDRLEFYENDQIAFTYINEQEVASMEDDDGIVEMGRNIEGVEISILAKETGKNVYKISLRSNDYVNVSDISLIYNGGGHPRAAGCTIRKSLEDTKQTLINECKKYLK